MQHLSRGLENPPRILGSDANNRLGSGKCSLSLQFLCCHSPLSRSYPQQSVHGARFRTRDVHAKRIQDKSFRLFWALDINGLGFWFLRRLVSGLGPRYISEFLQRAVCANLRFGLLRRVKLAAWPQTADVCG